MGSVSHLHTGGNRTLGTTTTDIRRLPDWRSFEGVHARLVPASRLGPSRRAVDYVWEIAPGVFEVLCVPDGGGFRYLGSEQLRGLAPGPLAELRAAARRNSAAVPVDSVELHNRRAGEYQQLSGSSPFVAAKILDPAAAGLLPGGSGAGPVLVEPAASGSGEVALLAGIPSAYTLLVHRLRSLPEFVSAVDAMVTACRRSREVLPAPLSADLFLWRRGALHRITRVDAASGDILMDEPAELQDALADLAH